MTQKRSLAERKQAWHKQIDREAHDLLASTKEPGFTPRVRIRHGPSLGPNKNKNEKRLGETSTFEILEDDEDDDYRTYIGTLIGAGQWKETFELKSKAGDHGRWNGRVLKMTKMDNKAQLDVEARVFKKTSGQGVTPEIFAEFFGRDNHECLFHCWITQRVFSLSELLESASDGSTSASWLWLISTERLTIGLSKLVLRLAINECIFLTDCRLDNFGLMYEEPLPPKLLLIDAGHLDIHLATDKQVKKSNDALRALWQVTEHFAPIATNTLRLQHKPQTNTREAFMKYLEEQWESNPCFGSSVRAFQEELSQTKLRHETSQENQRRPCKRKQPDDIPRSSASTRHETSTDGTQGHRRSDNPRTDLAEAQSHVVRIENELEWSYKLLELPRTPDLPTIKELQACLQARVHREHNHIVVERACFAYMFILRVMKGYEDPFVSAHGVKHGKTK